MTKNQNVPSSQRVGNLSGYQMIQEASEYVKKHISKQPPVQRFFSFMPTLLTRVSPFHFKSRTQLKDWPLVRLDSSDGNSWGRMRVVGELLIIFDETVLFCILALMTEHKTDAFETNLTELCDMADIQPTTGNFNSIWTSLQRLAGCRIDLILSSGKGKKKKSMKEMTGSILSFGDLDRSSGKIRIGVNPYFLEMYAESFVTNIDLKFRSRLKDDVSKAFYRFYQGQYENEFSINLLKLADAVNLDIHQDTGKLRSKVRNGLRELKAKVYLDSFEITKDNNVHISKNKNIGLNFNNKILNTSDIQHF